MATILDLEQRGHLERFDVGLEQWELAQRSIYLLAECAKGLNERLEKMQSEWDTEHDPGEQLYALAHHFITGGVLDFPRQFHDMYHRREGIWELKTADLRLFGWFVAVDCFVCSDIHLAHFVKYGPGGPENSTGSLYAGLCEQVGYRRENLDLDPPKYLTGTEPSDVVSNSHKS